LCLSKVNPDVIYSFLTTSNIVALAGRLFINKPVVWGIRASYMNLEAYDWLAKLTAWVENKLSRFANIIIFNAQYSRQYHESLGYRLQRAMVIPNGIDTDVFRPQGESVKDATRDQLGIPRDAVVVGMLARVDPMKDYETYLNSANALILRHKKLYFIAAGAGTKEAPWTYPPRFIPLGIWKNVPELLNALDIMVLSSFGEGFPNVVGEAMACGIPTIVSDVGDAAYIVGDQGMTIPSKDPAALIQAIETYLKKPPSQKAIRNRIVTHFSVTQMVDLTLQTLTRACHRP
jgi:glycosyltransferase involved in cell wall biosynthesis